jgi:NADH-quinone oxidoreductase subunit L
MANPGRLYVVATLLPLAAFFVLLLGGAIRNVCGPYRETHSFARFAYFFLGGNRPLRAGAYLATSAIALAAVLAIYGLFRFLDETHTYKKLDLEPRWAERTTWAQIGPKDSGTAVALELGYRVDHLTAIMFAMVAFVSTMIFIFSLGYMGDEARETHEDHEAHVKRPGRFGRFFLFLSLFCFSMLNLLIADNLFQVFISWELVGVCSFFLIGFYHERESAAFAANKAFIVNRIGDAGFLIGLAIVWTYFGTFNFEAIFSQIASGLPEGMTHNLFAIAGIGIFLGCVGKSAQFPLHTWLPDAMEGPTPVSALIHAATMVTAGVNMIGRNAVLFSHAPETMMIVAVIGALTALMAGTIGLVQNDIKRVLAYSTVSQLGYMFLAMGVGAFGAGIFHLYTHAFFKALLFLGSGAVIHALHGEQDIRNMGGLRKELPLTCWTFVIGAVAIAGVPGFAGFFSKDEILFETYAGGHTLLWIIGVTTSLLTATYMFRLVFLTFWGERHRQESSSHGQMSDSHVHGSGSHPSHAHGHASGSHLHDAPPAMALALLVLAIGSVAAGWVGIPHALGGHNQMHAWLEPAFETPGTPEPTGELVVGDAAERVAVDVQAREDLERTLMLFSSVIALMGIAIAYGMWVKRRDVPEAWARRFGGVYLTLLNKYYVDEAYDATIVQPIEAASREGLWRWFDVKVIDGAVNGTGAIVDGGAALLRRLQTGSVRAYAGSLFIGVVVILGYYLWR